MFRSHRAEGKKIPNRDDKSRGSFLAILFFTFSPLPAVCLCRHHRSEVEKLLFLSLKLLLLSSSLLPFPSLAFYACGFLAIRTSTTS